MNETDYNARIYEKMKAEQDNYRDWLLHQKPPEILNHTYESYLQKVQVKYVTLHIGNPAIRRAVKHSSSISFKYLKRCFSQKL